MKKLFWLAAISLSILHPLIGFDGLYVGGGIGGCFLDGRHEGSSSGSLGTGGIANTYISDLNGGFFNENCSGDIFAGFGRRWNGVYAGVEVFGQYSRGKSKYSHQHDNLFPSESASEGVFNNGEISMGPWHYGIDFRPGILLTPQTLLYGRVGVTGASVKFKTRASNAGVLVSPFDVVAESTKKKHGHFLHVGLGMEQFLCSNIALRWEYVFTNYRTFSTGSSNSGAVVTSDLNVADATEAHLKTHEVKLALAYHFSRFAYNCCQLRHCYPAPHFCGWYLGAGVGGGLEDSHYNVNLLNIAPVGITPASHTHVANRQFTDKSVRALGYGGYSLQFDFPTASLFAGLEVFGQYSPYVNRATSRNIFVNGFGAQLFASTTTVRSSTKIQPWQYGIQLRPGIVLSPSTLLFGTVGVSAAKFECNYNIRYDNPTTGTTFSRSVSKHNTRPVLRLGGGLEYNLYNKWHIRADYMHTNYRSIRLRDAGSLDTGLGLVSLISDSRAQFNDNAVTIGITRYL